MGDDAAMILVLDEHLKEEKRIPIFPAGQGLRIPKPEKPDLEASFVIEKDGKKIIVFLGSGSLSPQRDSAFIFDPNKGSIERVDLSKFYNFLRQSFNQLNIEAATFIHGEFAFGIRANTSSPDNFIVFSAGDIHSPEFRRTVKVKLPVSDAGMSGMDYDEETDRLFITFSSENTPNPYDDGPIGESYLAIIDEARARLQNPELTISSLTRLGELSIELISQKIESVALIKGSPELLLVADDDKGGTILFKLRF